MPHRPGLSPFLREVLVSAAEAVAVTEALEAEIRTAMARVTKARGWDTQQIRDDEIAWIDALLDEWNEGS